MSSHVRTGEAALGAWRKRKDREPSDSPRARSPEDPARSDPDRGNNRLLAGCLAHEFLTRGTLLGKQWETSGSGSEPDNNEAAPVRPDPSAEPARPKPPNSYAEVSYLLKADGARLPGVVNPTQLARWLQM